MPTRPLTFAQLRPGLLPWLLLAACGQPNLPAAPGPGAPGPYARGPHTWKPAARSDVRAQSLSGDVFVSSLTPSSASNGWGPIEPKTSNGEDRAGDGHTMSMNGTKYAQGLGVHADSEVTYPLDGQCTTFSATVGLDDEIKTQSAYGSVTFKVVGDGQTLFESPVIKIGDAPKALSVGVSGVKELKLVVGNGGDNNFYDHADWADARLSCAAAVGASVTAYRDSNFGGVSQAFGAGTYRADQGGLATVGNDAIRSLKVPAGVQVKACQNEGDGRGSGSCTTYPAGDYPDLGSLDNQISFLQVSTDSTPAPTPTPTPPPEPAPSGQAPTGAALTPGPIAFPDGFMQSVKDYGAVGDGQTDDTAAIQQALDDGRSEEKDYYGLTKALYFPAGTYLVSDTLQWRGCCLTLQGQGSTATVIKLRDGAAGFGSPGSPKPVIRTPGGNVSFRQNVWDLQINTGSGNAGAVGLDYISSNSGAVRDVAIVSGDGQGKRGLDMTRQSPGPLLIKNVSVRGFDAGIEVAQGEYGPTFENITLSGQRVAGILNTDNTLAIRNLVSQNAVPAIRNTSAIGHVIVLDAKLDGGAGGSAIENSGYLYARNVTTGGYGSAISSAGSPVSGTSVKEYVSGKVFSLFSPNPPAASLNLPVQETPSFVEDASNWAAFKARYYGDTEGLQAALDSGKSTVYFPFGNYFSYSERVVTVPASVRRIVGFSSGIVGGGGTNGGGIRLVVSQASSEPLIVEGFGYNMKIDHNAARPVVLKDGEYIYTSTPGAGDLYLEDVIMYKFTVQAGQHVWARQLNDELRDTKITNDGGTLWILGLKTEGHGTVIETRGGGSTELLGTLIYPADQVPASDVAFVNRDSKMSLIYSTSVYPSCGACGYTVQVEETRNGVTKQLATNDFPGRMPLYVGY